MAVDKAVDSTALDADLLAVADAIRAKVGTSDAMAFPDGFVEAIEAIAAGGGESAGALSGSFTTAENLYSVEVDVGKEFSNFLCYAATTDGITGNSVKVTQLVQLDLQLKVGRFISTNNAGTAGIAVGFIYVENDDVFTTNPQAPNTSSRAKISGNTVAMYGATSGNVLGCFLSGITYQWYAW